MATAAKTSKGSKFDKAKEAVQKAKKEAVVEKKRSTPRIRQPLITRHRPERFDDLIGMDATAKALESSIKAGDIPNAFLLVGSSGGGKTTTARIIARYVMCETLNACGKCASCQAAEGAEIKTHPDYQEINCGTDGKIEDIRMMISQSRMAPMMGTMRVIVLDEVHRLSGASAEAILKPLEEPSEKTLFILATTETNSIKDTIKNRCQQILFKPVEIEVLADYLAELAREDLEEGLTAETIGEVCEEVAQLAGGAIRESLGIMDQVIKLYRSSEDEDIDVKAFLEDLRQEILNNTDVDVQAAQKILLGILNRNPKVILKVLASHSDFVGLSNNMVRMSQHMVDMYYEVSGSNIFRIPAFMEAGSLMVAKFEEKGYSKSTIFKMLTILSNGIVQMHGKIMSFQCPERPVITSNAMAMIDAIGEVQSAERKKATRAKNED